MIEGCLNGQPFLFWHITEKWLVAVEDLF